MFPQRGIPVSGVQSLGQCSCIAVLHPQQQRREVRLLPTVTASKRPRATLHHDHVSALCKAGGGCHELEHFCCCYTASHCSRRLLLRIDIAMKFTRSDAKMQSHFFVKQTRGFNILYRDKISNLFVKISPACQG